MGLECLSGLKQRLQAGKNTWPSIGAGSVSGVILGPFVMRHRYFCGFGLGHLFDSCARRLIILAHCEGVLKDFWRLKPQDLPSDVGHGLAIGSRAHPCEQATRLKVCLKLSAREDDAVRLLRHEAFPHLLRGGGNVEDIFQWCLLGPPEILEPFARLRVNHMAYSRPTVSLASNRERDAGKPMGLHRTSGAI